MTLITSQNLTGNLFSLYRPESECIIVDPADSDSMLLR